MSKPATLQSVADAANVKYWEAHALLHALWFMTKDLDDDYLELKELLRMAAQKVSEMQDCFNPHLTAQSALREHAEVTHA